MSSSELAIIYLAAAAPFGVSRFFKGQERGEPRPLARAAAAALAWPLTALRFLSKNLALRRSEAEDFQPDGRRVESVKRAAVNALLSVDDLLFDGRDAAGEAERHALFAARESVERYAGLALACASSPGGDEPSARETELFRVAGRAGDDLLVAGRCVRRRNASRLLAHRERARSELVHALAAALEAAHDTLEVRHNLYPSAREPHSAGRDGESTSKEVCEALLRALSRAVELLSLFDDRAAVVSVARLIDAESARRARLEARASAGAVAEQEEGEESCTTQAAHTAFATPPLLTRTSQGG